MSGIKKYELGIEENPSNFSSKFLPKFAREELNGQAMKTIHVKLKKVVDNSYGITVGTGLLPRLPEILRKEHLASAYVIIADATTGRLFGRSLHRELLAAGVKSLLLTVPKGERAKTQAQKTRLEETMLEKGIDRKALVLALGGGVVGDLAGFVAATYMRGIPYIQIPTTFLAMVDSSIGGKTGINSVLGKNVFGAFWQPRVVYADLDTIYGLPQRALACGLVEALKMFITSDKASWRHAVDNLDAALRKDSTVLAEIIVRAAKVKARIVRIDERENGARTILNFGHTIGHALEKLSGYMLLHGEAVALGMLVEGIISRKRDLLSEKDLKEMQRILRALGTDFTRLKGFNASAVIRATKGDKKAVGGHARYVLLRGIGHVAEHEGQYAHPVGDAEVRTALAAAIKER